MSGQLSALRWCLLPDFDVQSSRPPARATPTDRVRSRLRWARPARFAPGVHATASGVLFVTRAENERRVLFPVLGGKGEPVAVPGVATGRTARDVKRRVPDTLDWVDDILAQLGRKELRDRWHALTIATEMHRLAYERMDLTSYRCVVVPRQSHPFVRALIQAAHSQGVPVAYLPHSPLTRWQVDLPVTHAGVRGEAERDVIVAETGADRARIAVIGNPATDALSTPLPHLDPGRPGVVALGPDSDTRIAPLIDMVAGTGLDRVIVAPHPRSDLRAVRALVPRGWRIHTGGHTLDVLREGPPWVVQSESGIAWDSTALGIPTANVRLDGTRPVYPFLDDRAIVQVDSPDALKAFITDAPRSDRNELRDRMRNWVAYDDAEAAARARRLIDDASTARRDLIADTWAPGGVLWNRSPLSRV